MTEKRVLRNTNTGAEFEVLAIDKEKGTVTLKGQLAEFVEPLDWERFKSMGYKRATVEVADNE